LGGNILFFHHLFSIVAENQLEILPPLRHGRQGYNAIQQLQPAFFESLEFQDSIFWVTWIFAISCMPEPTLPISPGKVLTSLPIPLVSPRQQEAAET